MTYRSGYKGPSFAEAEAGINRVIRKAIEEQTLGSTSPYYGWTVAEWDAAPRALLQKLPWRIGATT